MQRPNVEKMREQYSQYFMGGKPITVNLKDDIYSLFDYIDYLELTIKQLLNRIMEKDMEIHQKDKRIKELEKEKPTTRTILK